MLACFEIHIEADLSRVESLAWWDLMPRACRSLSALELAVGSLSDTIQFLVLVGEQLDPKSARSVH